MSHNSKYYVKKLPKVVKNNYKIDSFFSQPSALLSTENKKFIKRDEIFSKLLISSLTCVISKAKPVSLFVYHRPVVEKNCIF